MLSTKQWTHRKPVRSTRGRASKNRVKSHFAVERLEDRLLLTAGDLDPYFGQFQDGKVITEFAGSNGGKAEAVAIQSDGKIVAVGYKQVPTPSGNFASDIAAVRYDDLGNLDQNFGNGGVALVDFGAREVGKDLVIQPDGKIVIAATEFFNNTMKVVRLDSSGNLDASFGNGGGVTLSPISADVLGIALQADGKLVVAGESQLVAVVLRLNADGSVDDGSPSDTTPGDSFGGDGIVDYPSLTPEGSFFRAHDVLVQPDGKIVLVGDSGQNSPNSEDFVVARLNSDGSDDVSFDGDGLQLIDFGPGSTFTSARAVVLDASGRIVVGGYASMPGSGTNEFAVVRLNPDGSQDPTFNGDGRAFIDLGGTDVANDVAILSNGRILLVGESTRDFNFSGYDFAMVSLNANGSLDGSFGNGGLVTTTFDTGTADFGLGVAIQADGRIVVAGVSTAGNGSRFVLARYEGGPPTNDNFEDAQLLTGASSVADIPGSTRGATVVRSFTQSTSDDFLADQAHEPFHAVFGGRSVWYRWTAPYSAVAGFGVVSTEIDTGLAVYVEDPELERLNQVAFNDDFGDNRTSAAAFDAIRDTTYFIAVDGYAGAQGSFGLGWVLTEEITPGPVPERIDSLAPSFVQAGNPTLDQNGLVRIGIHGANFTQESKVFIDSRPIQNGETLFFSIEELEARIPPSYFAFSRELRLTVRTADRVSDAVILPVVRFANLSIQPGATITLGTPPNLLKPGLSALMGNFTCQTPLPCDLTVAVGIDPGFLVPARLLGQDGASVVANDGAGLIGQDGASLQLRLSNVNLSAINGDQARAIAALQQAKMIGDAGSTLIGPGLGSIFFRGGTSIVAGGGGNIVGGGGGNFIGAMVNARSARAQDEDGWFLAREADGTLPEITVTDNGDGTATITATLNMAGMPVPGGLDADEGLLFTLVLDPNLVEFTTTAATVSEDGTSAVLTVTRTGDTATAVSVDFATSNGTATAGEDYTETVGTLSFAADETSKTVTIPLLDDDDVENDETLRLTLSNPGGLVMLGLQDTATLTITSDDVPDTTPPTITNVQLIPAGKKIGQIVLTFSEDVLNAQVASNYSLASVKKGKVKPAALSSLGSAVYSSAAHTLTFTPTKPVAAKKLTSLRLTVLGSGTLTDLIGNPLDGDVDGSARGDCTTGIANRTNPCAPVASAVQAVTDELIPLNEAQRSVRPASVVDEVLDDWRDFRFLDWNDLDQMRRRSGDLG